MSDKISYILEVQDNFSIATTKFKKQITAIDGILKSLNNELDLTSTKLSKFGKGLKFNFNANADLDKLSKSMDKVATSAGKMRKATTGFILGESFSNFARISASEIRKQKALQTALVPYYARGVMVGGRSSSSISNPRRYSPNFTLPIDSSYRRNYSQSTALTPYNPNPYGTGVSIYGNYRGKIIDGIYKDVSEEILSATKNNSTYRGSARPVFAGAFSKIKFDNETGGWVSADKSKIAGYGAAGLLGGRLGASGIASGLGFAGAAYTVGRSVKYVHDTTVQMDSLRASLSALIPKVKGLEKATSESEIQYLRGVSNKYGLNFSSIATSYMQMLGTGGGVDASLAKGATEAIGGYGGLMGLKAPALQDTMTAVQQMLTKKNLSAEEVNRQTQQLPGLKGMFFEAFYRIAKRQGVSGVTPENASSEFYKAMAKGNLDAALMIREVIKGIFDKFGEDMIKKSHKLQGEENRLASANQELATTLGDLAYPATIGAVTGMTNIVNAVDETLTTVTKSFSILDTAMKDSKLYQIAKGMFGGLGTVLTEGTSELIKAPFKLASAGGGLITGRFTGDDEGMKEIKRELRSYYFGNPQQQTRQMPQEVIVKITTENMPDFFKVKQDQNMSLWRPETIGGR